MRMRFSLIFIAAFIAVFSISSAHAGYSFPYPDFGASENTVADPDQSRQYDLEDEKSVEQQEQVDYLSIYAPAGFQFIFSFFRLNDDYVIYEFEGKGREEPSFQISYSELYNGGIKFDGIPVFGCNTGEGIYYCTISNDFGTLSPSIPNFWHYYSANANGDVALSFITYCLKYNNCLYINLTDYAGHLIEGIEVTPNPVETYRPSNDDSDAGIDLESIGEAVSGFAPIISYVWDIFPYFGVMIAIYLVILYLKVVL